MGEEKRRDETATEKGRETWWEKENADKKSKRNNIEKMRREEKRS